jgi:hypothetical protein
MQCLTDHIIYVAMQCLTDHIIYVAMQCLTDHIIYVAMQCLTDHIIHVAVQQSGLGIKNWSFEMLTFRKLQKIAFTLLPV